MTFLSNPKKILIVFLTLSILGLILPVQNANAQDLLRLLINPAELGLSIFVTVLTVPLFVFLNLGMAFFAIANLLLSAVIGDFLISLSYTNPVGNPILDVGWSLTRDLANMGFVIALVYIGLATALRLGGIETKKTLVRLIVIALLINFTPIVCGIVVDASNIVMNFFLEGTTGFDAIAKISFQQMSLIWEVIGNLTGVSLATSLSAVAKVVAFIFFNLVAGSVLFLFAFLFFARHVAIWILVILSPIAFFCYILPNTKPFFDQWWKQFLNWSLVGAVAAFFLYLSQYLLMMIDNESLVVGTIPSGPGGGFLGINIEGLLNTYLPYMIIVIFLFIGLLASLGIGAAGASQIITTVKSTGTKARRWTGKAGKWGAKATGKAIERKLETPKHAERLGRWAAQKPGLREVMGKPLIGYARRVREAEKKELKGMPLATVAAMKGKNISEIIQGMGVREYVRELHPDDITLEALLAASPRQIGYLGERGSVESKRAHYRLIIQQRQAIAAEVNRRRIQQMNLGRGQQAEFDRLEREIDAIETKTGRIQNHTDFDDARD
ncbi:hypothetical protein AMJ49_04075 [Parcubacteria bacterium DG_74_2]|nr:MAG: hypothetical protein AMJ49_04075 [Parcubacteria bacterium DG_74_2]